VTYVREGVIICKSLKEEPIRFEPKEFGRSYTVEDSTQYAFNLSESEEAHIFQCGFDLNDCAGSCEEGAPNEQSVKKLFTHAERQGILKMIASSDGRNASLSMQQDIQIFSTFANDGNHIIHQIMTGRSAWLHVVKGRISYNDLSLQTGDGLGLTGERSLSFTAKCPTEILLFDLCKAKDEIKETSKSKPQAAEAR
jgi:redox-sensitive bicupin YhaK (pirin superfamily)